MSKLEKELDEILHKHFKNKSLNWAGARIDLLSIFEKHTREIIGEAEEKSLHGTTGDAVADADQAEGIYLMKKNLENLLDKLVKE